MDLRDQGEKSFVCTNLRPSGGKGQGLAGSCYSFASQSIVAQG